MERPRSLGEALATGITTSFLSSPAYDCRSPVTPRIPRTPRTPSIPGSASSLAPPDTSAPAQDEQLHPIISSGLGLELPTASSFKNARPTRPESLKPESLHLSSLRWDGVTDRFLPLSAQSITPSLIDQPSRVLGQNELTTFSAINLILGKTIGVGVYSVPSSVFTEVGSVGMTLVIWLLGAVISFCGLSVYLDLGTALPRSGGERVYLERIFRRPKMLATSMFMAYVVLLGFSTPNCIILGNYAVSALGVQPTVWNVRGIAVFVISLACFLHARVPATGLRIINVLGVGKMLILAAVVLSGIASIGRVPATAGSGSIAQQNFTSIWAGTSSKPYNYATALLQVLYCFRGYNTANQVMSEVRNPISTIKVAGPVALTLASLGYILANVAYFCAVEKDDFRSSGVVVASHYLRNIFGSLWGERILPCFIIISAFGNIAATSFAQARVNQELGAQGLLPASGFWRRKNAAGAPASGLLLHWLVSVLVIVLPPPGEIYTFLVEIGGYPVSVLSVAIASGLLYLQNTSAERWQSPCPAPRIHTIVFLASNALLLIFPWINPGQDKSGNDNKRFAYYAYPATSLGIIGMGAVYWLFWQMKNTAELPVVGTPLLHDWSSAATSSQESLGEDEGGGRVGGPYEHRAPLQKSMKLKLEDMFVVELEVEEEEQENLHDSYRSSMPTVQEDDR
ncbi:High-affinity methionine permease [Cladophialophora carrionii]|uniref:High-affinity methionine permease n=1 Tax=Cladophialophora carrionii TaxID=86049 RepID=A0A1C1CKI1_9EURO|nr:High-affinity methionine permease [Cladophialophora carrionii]